MNKLFFIVVWGLLFFQSAVGQSLIHSRNTSFYTYFYKINDLEARELREIGVAHVDNRFFHTLVDSVPTDAAYQPALPPGHYMRVFTRDNVLQFELATIATCEVRVLNNAQDLKIQVFDPEGKLIQPDEIKLKRKSVKWDKQSQSYRIRNGGRDGLLEVRYEGMTHYFKLEETVYKKSRGGKIGRILYIPAMIVWRPIRWALFLPIDIVRSIVQLRPRGSVYRFYAPFRDLYRAIRYRDHYGWTRIFRRRNRPSSPVKHTGYLTFSKPKYRPGDTLKLKLYAANSKGKPLKDVLKLRLPKGNGFETIDVAPTHPGCYTYEAVLNPERELKLDRDYQVYFMRKRKIVRQASFHYEDYELKDVTYELKQDKKVHYPDDPLTLTASAKDPNGLPLADVHLTLTLQTKRLLTLEQSSVFIPDTLWSLKMKLAPDEDTKVVLPDSVFPPAALMYTLTAKLNNAEQTVLEKKFDNTYYYHRGEVRFEETGLGLTARYYKNGQVAPAEVKFTGLDGFGKTIYSAFVDLPYEHPISPWVSEYRVELDGQTYRHSVSAGAAQVVAFPRRTRDSVFIEVSNPRKLPISYHIYRHEKELERGHRDTVVLDLKARSKKNHFFSLQYLWRGQIQEEQYAIPLLEKMLSVEVEQPDVVVPGQESEMRVKVTDIDGKPVENVDLLAYGLNSQFKGYAPPSVPNFQKSRKGRRMRTNYTLHQNRLSSSAHLDYELWRRRAGLDSIPRYKFLYPKDKVYKHLVNTPDGGTEFAPFVVRNGGIQAVHIIYVDGNPIYFSWNKIPDPYSFRIKPGYHRIGMRLYNYTASIDSVYFPAGKKTIFSVDLDRNPPKFNRKMVKPHLEPHEIRFLNKYIAAFHPNRDFDLPYFKDENRIFKLPTSITSKSGPGWLFGPVTGKIEFVAPKQYSMEFDHEPNFSYEASKKILKMRSQDWTLHSGINLNRPANTSLTDHPWTEPLIEKDYIRLLEDRRSRHVYFDKRTSTGAGKGSMFIELANLHGADFDPLSFILINTSDSVFGSVHRGNARTFHNLEPGSYSLIAFLRNDKSYTWENLEVRPNGQFAHQLSYPDPSNPTAFQRGNQADYFRLVRKLHSFNSHANIYDPYPNPRPKPYHRQYYNGPTDRIIGRVIDSNGDPVLAATIMVDSTHFGTYTDFDGYFELDAPPGMVVVVARMIGMETVRMYASCPGTIEIIMHEGAIMLEEVKVTSRRVYRDQLASSSIIVESADMMQVRGVSRLKRKKGKSSSAPPAVSSQQAEPLYVVDGVVWNGKASELPTDIVTQKRISADEAKAIFGSRGANGAVLITTAAGLRKQKPEDALGDEYMDALAKVDFLRDNFRDDAFWQPSLLTDENGEARFKIKFPDDITSWKTFALGMKKGGYTGQTEGAIRSFKPIMGQLRIPRFLLEGDTAFVIGKGVNYTPDSLQTTLTYSQDGQELSRMTRRFRYGVDDSAAVTVGRQDSTRIRFVLETDHGYKDGEERKIPVFPVGVVETNGHFASLPPDTTLVWDFDPQGGPVTVYAETDLMGVLRRSIHRLHRYGYLCNEQASSKLKAYLIEKKICSLTGEKFKYNRDIKKLLKLLAKRQLPLGGWTWWEDGKAIPWISLNVTEALAMAEEAGYETGFQKGKLIGYARRVLEDSLFSFEHKMRSVEMLMRLKVPGDFSSYIKRLESYDAPRISHHFRLIRLKQQAKMPYDLKYLEQWRQTDLFGNSYWGDSRYYHHIFYNEFMTTLLAYKILKEDGSHPDWVSGIVGYLLDARSKSGYWRNTYEAAQILEALYAELGGADGKIEQPKLQLSGALSGTVTEFPYTATATPGQSLSISKPGNYPVYVTAYQRRWEPKPKADGNNFRVKSRFHQSGSTEAILQKGKEVILNVRVEVEKAAEYVMVEIPIPAGCTYASKARGYSGSEIHREHYRHKVAIFANRLAPGTHNYQVKLMPKYSGHYSLNPAKAEMMYFPVFYGRETVKRIKIQ